MKVNIDGYFFFKDFREDLYLMIADEEYDIVFDYIKEKHIKNIMLSFTGGCSGEDLEFLKAMADFEKIHIQFDKPVDLSNLYYQAKLKTLKIGSVPFKLDFSRFQELEYLSIFGQKQQLKPFLVKHSICK